MDGLKLTSVADESHMLIPLTLTGTIAFGLRGHGG